jgi:hypothetical protein
MNAAPSSEPQSQFGGIDIYLFDQLLLGRFDGRRRILGEPLMDKTGGRVQLPTSAIDSWSTSAICWTGPTSRAPRRGF